MTKPIGRSGLITVAGYECSEGHEYCEDCCGSPLNVPWHKPDRPLTPTEEVAGRLRKVAQEFVNESNRLATFPGIDTRRIHTQNALHECASAVDTLAREYEEAK